MQMAFHMVRLAYAEPGTDDIVFSPEALELVAKWPPNTKVISICGLPYEGKSTLCRIILRYLAEDWSGEYDNPNKNFFPQDFEKMNGCNAKDKPGVWILNKPIVLPNKPGAGDYLVIVDTEGTNLGNDDLTMRFSAVSCFLSSLFVCYLPGTVACNHVKEIAQLVKCMNTPFHNAIRKEIPKPSNGGRPHDGFIPPMLVVSSNMGDDWLVENGFETTTTWRMNADKIRMKLKTLLLNRLAPHPLPSKVIKAFFADPEYAFVRAMTESDIDMLQNNCQVDERQSKFGTSVSALVYRMFRGIHSKGLDGKPMDWKKMPQMLAGFVNDMNPRQAQQQQQQVHRPVQHLQAPPSPRCIELISVNDLGKFVINPQAKHLLTTLSMEQSKKGLGIICLIGDARTGKSTLGNLLCGLATTQPLTTSIFATSGGDKAKTHGIWMVDQVIHIPNHGAFLIIDTEGMNLGNDSLTGHLSAISATLASRIVFSVPSVTFGNTQVDTLARMANALKETAKSTPPQLLIVGRKGAPDVDVYDDTRLQKALENAKKSPKHRDSVELIKSMFPDALMCVTPGPEEEDSHMLNEKFPRLQPNTTFSRAYRKVMELILSDCPCVKITPLMLDTLSKLVARWNENGESVAGKSQFESFFDPAERRALEACNTRYRDGSQDEFNKDKRTTPQTAAPKSTTQDLERQKLEFQAEEKRLRNTSNSRGNVVMTTQQKLNEGIGLILLANVSAGRRGEQPSIERYAFDYIVVSTVCDDNSVYGNVGCLICSQSAEFCVPSREDGIAEKVKCAIDHCLRHLSKCKLYQQ